MKAAISMFDLIQFAVMGRRAQ
jgi:CheY-like chemotaxis protein